MNDTVKIEQRLKFLIQLLTGPGVDDNINHYERLLLSEEAEELYLKLERLELFA